jgi:hypothetical protein
MKDLNQRRKMTEHESTIEYLVERIGVHPQDAERRMIDDDLWLLEPEGRYPLRPDDERQWEQAFSFVEGLIIATQPLENAAIKHVLADAQARVMEAQRRARQRAQEASGH